MSVNKKKVALATLLETIYIQNHPDHRSSGMSPTALIYWGLRMGLITEAEKDEAMNFEDSPFADLKK